MKVTIYTINDCKFSEAERAYLKQNNIEFEEKNLETNRDFLTEMLAISNNFAGTPVTEIVQDSGEKAILKGFTAEEFDKALGITSAVVTSQTPAPADDAQPQVAQEPAPAPVTPEPAVATPEMPTPASETPVGTAMPTESVSQETPPVAVESLSQDTSNVVATPSENLMPPTQAEAAPVPEPLPPVSEENIGPISLDVTPEQTPVDTLPSEVPPMNPPAAAPQNVPAEGSPTPQEPAQAAPAPNPLDSVLENLQSQVGSSEEKKDEKPPAA